METRRGALLQAGCVVTGRRERSRPSAKAKSVAGTGGPYVRDGRAPIPSSSVTSLVMSRNRASGTGPELLLRKQLRKLGFRSYRVNFRGVPGRPDIAFRRQKLAVFVNGCYWHRCPTCRLPLPKTHAEFWSAKFERNQIRDREKIAELAAVGWRSVVVWEHELSRADGEAAVRIASLLKA